MHPIQDLIELFSELPDWEERYGYIISMGKKLEPYPEAYHTETYKVKGCTSQVWLVLDVEQSTKDHLFFKGDSDAIIVKGLVAILLMAYNGKSAQAILDTDIKVMFKQLGLEGHLSPIRRNGFFSMVTNIHDYALKLAQP